jgi:hypothetical protein
VSTMWRCPERETQMPGSTRRSGVVLCSVASIVWLCAGREVAWAQTPATKNKEEPKLGWSDTADLSLVFTTGNSEAQTIGFSDRLLYVWKNARFELALNATRSDSSDDRFFMLAPGQEFPVGGSPTDTTTSLVKPHSTPDVANYLASTRYQRNITKAYFWNVGLSWDSNDDAGIVRRYMATEGSGTRGPTRNDGASQSTTA